MNSLWPTIIKCITIFACVSVVTFAGCTAHENYVLGKAIQHGADPLKAACAIDVGMTEHICLVESAKQ